MIILVDFSGWNVHLGQKSSHFETSPTRSASVSPPRILPQSNFWACSSSEKRYTRSVVNFLGPLRRLSWPNQDHFGKFIDFFRAQFHEFKIKSLGDHQKWSCSAQKVDYRSCIGRIRTALANSLPWEEIDLHIERLKRTQILAQRQLFV